MSDDPRQIVWPASREEAMALPGPYRQRIAGVVFWLNLLAPVPSAPDYRWKRFAEGMRLLDLPDWLVDDMIRPHREWKDKRNARRRRKRKEEK